MLRLLTIGEVHEFALILINSRSPDKSTDKSSAHYYREPTG